MGRRTRPLSIDVPPTTGIFAACTAGTNPAAERIVSGATKATTPWRRTMSLTIDADRLGSPPSSREITLTGCQARPPREFTSLAHAAKAMGELPVIGPATPENRPTCPTTIGASDPEHVVSAAGAVGAEAVRARGACAGRCEPSAAATGAGADARPADCVAPAGAASAGSAASTGAASGRAAAARSASIDSGVSDTVSPWPLAAMSAVSRREPQPASSARNSAAASATRPGGRSPAHCVPGSTYGVRVRRHSPYLGRQTGLLPRGAVQPSRPRYW